MDQTDFNYLQGLLEKSSGIVLEAGKEYLADLRLTPLAQQKGFSSLSDLMQALRRDPNLRSIQAEVVEVMTINETFFFRDNHPFEVLRTLVLPSLIKSRSSERRLSFWCAAGSTGQEPYSVAMLIREYFPELASWRIDFIASDISKNVLERASKGFYSTLEVNRGLPASYKQKYFDQQGNGWQIKEEIRSMVEFHSINLIEDWPLLKPQDVIFIRNVMIYFSESSKRSILERMAKLLRPDGFLFLGGAETTLNLSDAFERIAISQTSCFRRKSKAVALGGVP